MLFWYRAVFLIGISLMLFAALPFLLSATSASGFYGFETDQPAPVIADPELGHIEVPVNGLNVVFFGYQHCGTVCPTQLVNLKNLHDSLLGAPIQFVFVSLDPERDSRGMLDAVMAGLGENFVAVRPQSNRAAQELALSYGDFSAKQGAGASYEFNHSAHFYVVTTSGRRKLVYTTPALDLDRVRDDLRRLLMEQKRALNNG